jgi:uncharacterized protein YndB with AHSA1/START domain
MLHGIEISAEPSKVYEALMSQEGLTGWWTSDSSVPEPEKGSKAEFGFNNRAVVFQMKIEKIQNPKLVVWNCVGGPSEWKGTKLKWQITPIEGGSELRFTHSKWKNTGKYFRMCNSTWGELMYRLKAYAERGERKPLFI